SGISPASVPDGSAGNLRRHGGDPGDCAGSGRAHEDRGAVERQGRGRGRSLRGHEGDAGAVDYPRVARRKDRHHRVSRGSGYVRGKSAAAGESKPGDDCGRGGQASGSGGGRYATLAGDREKRPERAAVGEAAGLEDRHQERGRKASGSGTADVGAGHADRNSAGVGYGTGRGTGRETEGGGREYGGVAGRYDAGATGSD